MSINAVLLFLEPYGPMRQKNVSGAVESWDCCCPLCGDQKQKLSVSELDDGRVLLKCWRGHGAADILQAIGQTKNGEVDWSILFPPRVKYEHKIESVFGPKPRRKATLDDHILAVAKADRGNGKRLSDSDKKLEFEAYQRNQRRRSREE